MMWKQKGFAVDAYYVSCEFGALIVIIHLSLIEDWMVHVDDQTHIKIHESTMISIIYTVHSSHTYEYPTQDLN